MNQIYSMESLIDTTQAQIVWGSHMSMINAHTHPIRPWDGHA